MRLRLVLAACSLVMSTLAAGRAWATCGSPSITLGPSDGARVPVNPVVMAFVPTDAELGKPHEPLIAVTDGTNALAFHTNDRRREAQVGPTVADARTTRR